MNTCELCGCTKEHVRPEWITPDGLPPWHSGFVEQRRCDPSCESENEVSE